MENGRHRRIVNVFGDIDMELACDVVNTLTILNLESNEPIIMQISSAGGDINATLLIIDVMDALKSDVYTVGLGICSSAASLLLAAGKKGHRSVNRNIFILLHEASGSMSGDAYDVRLWSSRFEKQRNVLLELYARYTNKSIDAIEKDIQKNLILNDGSETIKYGLADCIL